jgi:hypothetical protein
VKVVAVVVGVAVLAGAGVLGWYLFVGRYRAPDVDPAEARAVLPVIDSALQRGPWRGALAGRPESRWFCAEHVVEIRHEDAALKVGLDTLCEEYAPTTGALLRGSGEGSPKLVTLSVDGREVHRVETPPDGSLAAWAAEAFSTRGQAELRHRQQEERTAMADLTAAEARQAFGLPPDAPIRN